MRAKMQPLARILEVARMVQTRAFKDGVTFSYVRRVVEELDRLINVAVLRGQVGETISHHAATAAAEGEPWACILCCWLSWTVERNHCAKTLSMTSITLLAAVLAGLQILLLVAIPELGLFLIGAMLW